MKIYLHLIGLFLAIIMYITAPNTIDWILNFTCFLLFLFSSYIELKEEWRNDGIITFNTTFLFAFFLVSFCFPVFIVGNHDLYKQFEDISMAAFQYVNFNCLTKATCLSLIAFYAYMTGYRYMTDKHLSHKKITKRFVRPNSINVLFIFSLLSVIANMIMTVRSNGFVTNFSERPYIYDIFKVLLVMSLISNASKVNQVSLINFMRLNKTPLISAIIVTGLFTFFGDRSMIVFIGLVIVAFYVNYLKKIDLKKVLLVLLIGVTLLYSLRVTRKSDTDSLSSGNVSAFLDSAYKSISETSPLLLFSDLIGACNELCIGYDYTKIHGLYYPEQIIIVPFYAVPMMPNILSESMFGMSLSELNGAGNTNKFMASMNIKSTYGKHMVTDIFMRWGFLGDIIAFYLFGLVIANYRKKKFFSDIHMACWIILIGMSVYTVRSSLLDIIRPLAFIYFFYYLFGKKIA